MNKSNSIILLIVFALFVVASNARGNCTNDFCNYHGICDDTDTHCVCNSGYITFESKDFTECNYQQKNTLIAFLLEFFLGYAACGYFYLGQINLAVGQLIFNFVGLIPICIFACCGVFALVKECEGCGIFLYSLSICYVLGWTCGTFIWWVYALVVIAQGSILDGNGATIPQL